MAAGWLVSEPEIMLMPSNRLIKIQIYWHFPQIRISAVSQSSWLHLPMKAATPLSLSRKTIQMGEIIYTPTDHTVVLRGKVHRE